MRHLRFALLAAASLAGLVTVACSGEDSGAGADTQTLDDTSSTGGTGGASGGGGAGGANGGTGGAGSAGSAGGEPVPVDAALVARLCKPWKDGLATVDSCCSTSEASSIGRSLFAAITAACEPTISDSVAKGRVVVDAAALDACEATPALPPGCSALQQNVATGVEVSHIACAAAVKGQGDTSAPCRFQMECKDGLSCIGYSATLPGKCGALPKLGTTCYPIASGLAPAQILDTEFSPRPLCASGARCSEYGGGSLGTCIAQEAAGGHCFSSDDCGPGLSCRLGKCTTSSALSPAGGPCSRVEDCAKGLSCDGKGYPGYDQGTCVTPKAAGEACSTTMDACRGACDATQNSTEGKCASLCSSG